jgi:hypothetical protein
VVTSITRRRVGRFSSDMERGPTIKRVLPRGVADLMNTRSDETRLVLKRHGGLGPPSPPACNRRGSRSFTRARAGMAADCPRKSGKSQGRYPTPPVQTGHTTERHTTFPGPDQLHRRSVRYALNCSRSACNGGSHGGTGNRRRYPERCLELCSRTRRFYRHEKRRVGHGKR